MARRTREEAEKTRQLLLDTALEQYAAQGISNISLKAIAASAGVTHGALYWHFKNRDDLVLAIAESYILPFELCYLEQLQAIDQNALKALKSFLMDVIQMLISDKQAMQVYMLLYSRRHELPQVSELQQRLLDEFQLWMSYINRFLKQARKQKHISKKTKESPVAEMLLCQVFGVLNVAENLAAEDVKPLAQLTITSAIKGLEAI